MMWQVMGLYGITGQNKHKCPYCTASNMAEFGKYSAFDPKRGARTLNQQYQEIGKSKPGLGYLFSIEKYTEIISLICTTDTIAERAQHLKNVMTFLEEHAKKTNLDVLYRTVYERRESERDT
ncbi:unnamed protein product [Didymodactylos carnosus]|uniref:Uncharacterized protein n=1 Tax=Didymodactylos carnosus TaxID=1234261 RepID=A0A815YDL1_9BILA|nr:unnamed protein product [Didymodactylos carnosus]CAF4433367.1 unnamed protein product [Didymodactylos carnosus]